MCFVDVCLRDQLRQSTRKDAEKLQTRYNVRFPYPLLSVLYLSLMVSQTQNEREKATKLTQEVNNAQQEYDKLLEKHNREVDAAEKSVEVRF